MAAAPRIIAEWLGKAIWVPMLGAGTLYLVSLLLAAQMTMPGESWAPIIDLSELLPLVLLLIPASAIGALLSAIPLILGVSLMAMAGERNIGLRHPAIWALAGAAGPGIGLFFEPQGSQVPMLALTLTGAFCALLARRHVRWHEVAR